jgi:hypothetical protein
VQKAKTAEIQIEFHSLFGTKSVMSRRRRYKEYKMYNKYFIRYL